MTTTTDTTTTDTSEVLDVREHVVGRVEDVPPGEGRAFVAGGVPVAVFRLRDGSLHATQAACPHRGGPLADGQTDARVLVCPLHQFAFRWEDGACTGDGPALRTHPVRAVDGDLVVTV
jgi:nitrite reductase/ring-hydroxylating ferredoxin subunit